MDSEKDFTLEKFEEYINLCKDGNLEEVKKWLNKYDSIIYFEKKFHLKERINRYKNNYCMICISIYLGKNDVLFELLERGFKPNGFCHRKYPCALETAVRMEDEEAVEALIVKGGSWKYRKDTDGCGNDIEDEYLESISKLLYSIIQKNGNGVNFKPAK